MGYVDKLKFSCNGIKLVVRNYGDWNSRNGLYIIDEELGKVLTDFMYDGKYRIVQDRYIVISHRTNYDTDRITVYDCLKKECLANNYECREIKWYDESYIHSLGGFYVVTFPDGKEHLLNFKLLGTDKDIFGMSADSIRLFYKDDDTYQLGISVNGEIKLYDKCIGINDNLELQDYSLVKANVSSCWYGQRIHVLKNKTTNKECLVMAKLDEETGKIIYEFDSYECDNIYFLDFYKDMVGSLHLSCFEKDGRLSVYCHDYIVSSIDCLRETKMFEVEGFDIEILNYIDTDSFLDGHCYEIYFSYTNSLGNKGILKFTRNKTYSYDGALSYETNKNISIDSIPVILPDTDNWSKWYPNKYMAIPVYSKDKMGFYSYKSNALIEPRYKDIIPWSDKYFFCYIDDNHFDVIERASVRYNDRNRGFKFILENCEIVYRENNDKVIVFKDQNGKYGIYISTLDTMKILDDMDYINVYKREFDDSPYVRSSFSFSEDGKLGFLYKQQIGYSHSNYEKLECKYKDIDVYHSEFVSVASLKRDDCKYELLIVSCFPD